MRNPMDQHSDYGSGRKVPSFIDHDFTSVPNIPMKVLTRKILDSHSPNNWTLDQEDAFFICDLGEVYRQYLQWIRHLPRIRPHFALKASYDPMVIKLLISLGVGFDCASKHEIKLVLDLGADPDQIIYANPCKQVSYIRYAAQQKVIKMTFDNSGELYKIKANYPHAELVLRILPEDTVSFDQLGIKFGASMASVPHLLHLAKKLSLNVIGISFHVGVKNMTTHHISGAIYRARAVFDQAASIGFNFSLLDIGGGFSGRDDLKEDTRFSNIAPFLGSIIDQYFSPDVDVISEPGRYFVNSAFILCTQVVGRRVMENINNNSKPSYMYYFNDGLFGSFHAKIFGVKDPKPLILMKNGKNLYGEDLEEPMYESSLWGPTCAHDDCIEKSIRLPLLNENDWVYWKNMGAYTSSVACEFNGFKKSKVRYTNTFTLHPFIAQHHQS